MTHSFQINAATASSNKSGTSLNGDVISGSALYEIKRRNSDVQAFLNSNQRGSSVSIFTIGDFYLILGYSVIFQQRLTRTDANEKQRTLSAQATEIKSYSTPCLLINDRK